MLQKLEMKKGENVLVTGLTGCGKTEFVSQWANGIASDKKVYLFDGNTGNKQYKHATPLHQMAALPAINEQSIREGETIFVVIDEIAFLGYEDKNNLLAYLKSNVERNITFVFVSQGIKEAEYLLPFCTHHYAGRAADTPQLKDLKRFEFIEIK
jgi:energy-coupling factor transporter ATP-binding protein EcfA2